MIGKSIFFSAIAQYLTQVIRFASVVIISRILSPDSIGLYSIASSFLFIIMELRTIGVAQYIIREHELDLEKIRSSYGVMLSITWGFGLLIAATAGLVADFYNREELTGILYILAAGFFLAPYTSLITALLSREFAFEKVLWIRLIPAVASLGFSVVFIYLGYEAYSLAIGAVLGTTIQFLICYYYSSYGIFLIPSFKKYRELLSIGLMVTIANISKQVAQHLPLLTLGKVVSMTQVAFFSRAIGLVGFVEMIVLSAVGPIILPYFAKTAKEDESGLKDAYLKSIQLIGGLALPVFATVSVISYYLIVMLFGENWAPASAISEILCWAIFFQVFHIYLNQALISIKKEKIIFYKEVFLLVLRIICLYLASVYLGEMGVAFTILVINIFEFLLNSYIVKTIIGVNYIDIFRNSLKNFIISLICWTFAAAVLAITNFESALSGFLFFVIVMPLVWLLSIYITRHPLYEHLIRILTVYKTRL